MRKTSLWLLGALLITLPLVFLPGVSFGFAVTKRLLLAMFVLLIFLVAIFDNFKEGYSFKLSEFVKNSQLFLLGSLIVGGAYIMSTFLSISPVLSFWGSVHRQQGLQTFILLLVLGGLLMLISPTFKEQESLKKSLKIGSLVVVLATILARFGFMKSELMPEQFSGRVAGTFQHPTFLAYFLLITAGVVAGEMIMRNKFRDKLDWVLLSSCLIGILLSGTRTALGLFFVLFLGVLVSCFKYRFNYKNLLIWGGLTILAFTLIIVALIFVRPDLFSLVTGQTRLLMWSTFLSYFGGRFLLGFGLETLPYSFQSHLPTELFYAEALFSKPDRLHNGYLQILHDAGLVGLVGFVMLLIFFFVRSYKTRRFDVFVPIVLASAASLVMFPSIVEQTVLLLLIIFVIVPQQEEAKKERNVNKWGVATLLIGAILLSISAFSVNVNQLRASFFERNGDYKMAASLDAKVPDYKQRAIFELPELGSLYEDYLIDYNPSSVEYFYLEARANYTKKEYIQTLELLEKALFLAPNDIRLWELKFDSEFYQLNYAEAAKTREVILNLIPDWWMECKWDLIAMNQCSDRSRILFKDNPELRVYFLKFAQLSVSLEEFTKADDYLSYVEPLPDYFHTKFLRYKIADDDFMAEKVLEEGKTKFPNAKILENLR